MKTKLTRFAITLLIILMHGTVIVLLIHREVTRNAKSEVKPNFTIPDEEIDETGWVKCPGKDGKLHWRLI